MDECTGPHNISEMILKAALNDIHMYMQFKTKGEKKRHEYQCSFISAENNSITSKNTRTRNVRYKT